MGEGNKSGGEVYREPRAEAASSCPKHSFPPAGLDHTARHVLIVPAWSRMVA
jgi:hypothetical protein